MIKNLRFTLRVLKRNPLLVFVNIPGLAIGLSVVLLLSVYINNERRFDKHFSTKNRVYRLYNDVTEDNKTEIFPICLRKAQTEIPPQIPEIEASTQIYQSWNVTAKYKDKQFASLSMLYADPEFFDVFGLNLICGDKNTALQGENNAVISASTARKIFNTTDCAGEYISLSEVPFLVTGVIEDLPKTTHFQFDVLGSMQTIHPEQFGGLELYTYFLLYPNADPISTNKKIAAINDELMIPWGEDYEMTKSSGLEKLSRLHMYSICDFDLSPKANRKTIGLIAGLAFFILLIALVNYINLYILHGEKRIAEISARKALGATKKNLALMFYTETAVIGFISIVLALFLSILARPVFSNLMQRPLEVHEILSPSGILILIGILIIIILISGAYPTFYLSRIQMVNGLKGKSDHIKRKSRLSSISVLVQFTISIFLILSVVVIHAQIKHLKDVPLGFSVDQVYAITGLHKEARKHYKSIDEEIQSLPFIEQSGFSFHTMGMGCSGQAIKIYGDPGIMKSIYEYRVQPGFCETMKLQLTEGRFLNDSESDKSGVILNQTAVKMLGLKNPIGTLVDIGFDPMSVVGVVEDFYANGHAGEPITPLMLDIYSDRVTTLYVRVIGDLNADKQKQITAVIKQFDSEYIFTYVPLSHVYNNKFRSEERVLRIITSGALLAIFISFIGLMALSVMQVSRRTKEIGIRKVMGSSEAEVVLLLLRKTMILVLIAMAIAFIAAYIVLQHWLSAYTDRIYLHAGYFLVSGIFALLIALLATGIQSFKAATRNPVEALHYE